MTPSSLTQDRSESACSRAGRSRRACTSVPGAPRWSAPAVDPGHGRWRSARGRSAPVGVAVRSKSPGTRVPPLSLVTFLIRISRAVSLTAVQRTDSPMKTMTPPLRPSAKPGMTLPLASISDALPAHRRAGDRHGVGAGPLDVARVAAGLGQRVPGAGRDQRADTGGARRPGGRTGRGGRAQVPGGRRGRAALTDLTRVSLVVQVTGLVIMNELVPAARVAV